MNQKIDAKWVLLGSLIIIGLNQILSRVLLEPVGIPLLQSMGLIGGLIMFALIIAVGSFFVGGIIIGRMSEGETIKEAGYASVVAIGVNVVIQTAVIGQFPGIIAVGIVAAIGYLLGVAGAKVGESLQRKAEEAMMPGGLPRAQADMRPPGDFDGPPRQD